MHSDDPQFAGLEISHGKTGYAARALAKISVMRDAWRLGDGLYRDSGRGKSGQTHRIFANTGPNGEQRINISGSYFAEGGLLLVGDGHFKISIAPSAFQADRSVSISASTVQVQGSGRMKLAIRSRSVQPRRA